MKRHAGIDIVRIIAMLSVIFLHTIYGFTVRTDFFLTKAWFVFEPFSAIARSSLALFFTISGYLVISKNRTVKENLKMTFQRIIIPFIFFSILASFFFVVKNGRNIFTVFDPTYIFGDILRFPNNWLWFLETLLFLYLLNPLWQGIFSDKLKSAEARYIVIFFFAFTCFALLLKYFTHTLLFFNHYTTWVAYICCYLYGALVRNKWFVQKSKFVPLLLFFVGLTIEVIGDYVLLLNQKNGTLFTFSGYFTDYIAIPPLLMAIGLFNFFENVSNIQFLNKVISSFVQKGFHILAVLSYGVYLVHVFIAQIVTDIFKWNIDSAGINIYAYNILFFTITLFGSIIITYSISRIPKLRLIIGNAS